MEIEVRKINFVQEFLRIQNVDLVEKLENLLHKSKVEIYENNLKPMSLQQLENQIDIALDDSVNDRLINVHDLKAKIKKWK